MIPQEHYLVVTVSGIDGEGILAEISKLCFQQKCNILESRMTKTGEHCALLFWVNGPWHGIAKLETLLPSISEKTNLNVQVTRTQNPPLSETHLPYSVQLTAIDRPGIMKEISSFFAKHRINIEDLSSNIYTAAKTNIKMCTLECLIRVPKKLSLVTLREEFMTYCDELNLDATLDPHN